MVAKAKEVIAQAATLPSAMPHPMELIAQATEAGTVEALGKLMDLQERYEANEARREYFAAIARFQEECPGIHKRKKGAKANYASIEDIQTVITPILSDCGLTISFNTHMRDEGTAIVATCRISHVRGHSEETSLTMPIPDMTMGKYSANDSQKMGAAMSYARRYAMVNALNLRIMGEDSDATYAGVRTAKVSEQQVATIRDYIEAIDGFDRDAFFAWVGCNAIEDIRADLYSTVVTQLKKRAAQ